MKNFELFMGCLGNGITVCNKAVLENNDYKMVAHISPKGNIKFYVSEDYIPADDMQRIRNAAKSERETFLENWNRKTLIQQYEIMLDEIPWTDMIRFLGYTKPLNEKVAEMTAMYMTI